jgi:hypothetical protein
LQGALESQWGIILHRVNKYCSYYANCEQSLGSGKTCDEIVSRPTFMLILLRKKLTLFNLQQGVEAKELYKADVGSSFTLEHCWVILQHSPKWQETMDKLASQNKKETKK